MCITEIIDVVNATTQVIISVQEAKATKAYNEYQSKVLENKSKEMKQYAQEEYQEGVEQARRQRLNSILRMGQLNTQMASGNISLSSGTAQNVLEDEKYNGELEALNTFNQYKDKYDNYMDASHEYYQDAALSSFKAKNSYKNSMFKIFKKESTNSLNSASSAISRLGG